MAAKGEGKAKGISFFERYLTIWVLLCIGAGIGLGKLAPGLARTLDGFSIYVNGAPVISIPIAICLFFMMYPIMVKIDFAEVIKAGKSGKPVGLTLFVNWAIKPFTMYAIAIFFLGVVFRGLIGPTATDLVKMPFGLDLPVGATHGAGTVVLIDGIKMLQVPLWRSYLAGCILLGIAPCTAMVLVWGYLARGNDGLTLVMVAINSLTMLVLYGPLGGFLLGVGRLPVPWQALLLSIAIYVALPLVAGYLSRRLDHPRERRAVVPGEVPARPDPDHDHRAPGHARAAVLLQGRGHPGQPADHPLDRDPAVHPDQPHLLAGLLARQAAEAAVQRLRRLRR